MNLSLFIRKKIKFGFEFFFSEKNPNLKEKKEPRKQFSFFNFFFHMDDLTLHWTLHFLLWKKNKQLLLFIYRRILYRKWMWLQLTMDSHSPSNIRIPGELTHITGHGWLMQKCHFRKEYEIWFCQSCPTWTLYKISVMNYITY